MNYAPMVKPSSYVLFQLVGPTTAVCHFRESSGPWAGSGGSLYQNYHLHTENKKWPKCLCLSTKYILWSSSL